MGAHLQILQRRGLQPLQQYRKRWDLASNSSNFCPSPQKRTLKSLSVSKQFLSITNRLRFSVTISDQTIPFLHPLFERFPNITSLKTTLQGSDIDALLTQISAFPVDLKSISIFDPITFPANGLRALSKKMTNLTSLTCYRILSSRIHKNDLFFIADCFPLLEELIVTDISYPCRFVLGGNDQFLRLFKLRKIALSRNFIGNHSIKNLCKNCDLIQEVKVIDYPRYAKVNVGGARCCGASRCCRPQYRGASGCSRPRYGLVSGCSRSRYHGASGCCCGASRCRRRDSRFYHDYFDDALHSDIV